MFSSNTTQTSGGYQISRSLRFNSADSAYLNRTPASASNRTTWTWSGWVKRSSFGTDQQLFSAGGSGAFQFLYQSSTECLQIYDSVSSTTSVITTQVFRDPSAWYHVVLATDTTQPTASNRFKLYINGVQVTSFGTATYPAQNSTLSVNNTVNHSVGSWSGAGGGNFFSGYMTEVNFIDGQQLTPSSFGYTNPSTGVWSPLAFVGSYGTNGFYLNFSDNSNTTAATLGKDYSGNGNNWTPNNFSVTAGAGNDSLVDSPTSYGTDTGVGGEVRGNYCTLNPLAKGTNTALSNGNLQAYSTTTWSTVVGTIGVTTGKWYWEYTASSPGFYFACGMATSKQDLNSYLGDSTYGWNYRWDGQKQTNGVASSYGASFGNTDVIGVAFDADAGTLVFYKNGTSQGTAFTGLTSGPYFPATTGYTNEMAFANFGQRPFAYTAPSGYKALCTQNLPTPTIGATSTTTANKYFDISLWTGNGSSQTITNSGSFQPDFVWTKGRSNADSNVVVNAIAGANQFLVTESQQAEATSSALVSAFTSSGFSIGSSTSINRSSSTYVGWQWKANGSGSTNTAGSITSTVSANTTSGFSVVTYTGTGANATVGHSLGVAPSMLIIKRRNDVVNWAVYHTSIGPTKYLNLDLTDAAATASTPWNNTAPTSTVFSIGTASSTNVSSSATYVAYCFAEVAGYSKFGSYTGNGSTDGTFVFTGMRPAFVMIKRTDDVGEWVMKDTTRSPYNTDGNTLLANRSDAEYGSGNTSIDELSNGFKCRTTSASANASGGTYIYMAFAQNPFKTSLAR